MGDAIERWNEQVERVQLIVLDLDGTVLSPTGHVTPRTRAAIRLAIDADIDVCIATGRSWWESREVIAEADLNGPGVFAGGSIVNDMPTGASLSDVRMHGDVARRVCSVIDRESMAAMVLQDRNREAFEWLIASEHPMPPTVPQWLARHGSSFAQVAGLMTASHAGTVRVSTVATVEDNARVASALREQIGDAVYLHEIIVPTTGISVIEIFDATVNKWSGVQRVAKLREIDERAIIAIGDDMNDLPMLRGAAIGVAMGNARDEVKQAANLSIASNGADGLARYLESVVTAGGLLAAAREWDQ